MAKKPNLQDYELARITLDMISDMIFWLDSNGKVFMVNQASCDILGYTRKELSGMAVNQIDIEYPEERWAQFWERLTSEKKSLFNSTMKKKNGECFPVEIHALLVEFGEEKYISAVVRDITARKESEKALIESEEKYQKSFHNVPSAVYLSSLPEGRLLEFNKAFENISGYSRDEIVGKTVEELNFYINPEDRSTLLHVLQKDGKLEEYEIYYRIKSGEHRLCSVNAKPTIVGGENYLIGNISDITDHRKSQLELARSEERNRQIINNLPVGTFISAKSGQSKYLSLDSVEIAGFSPEEILKMPVGVIDRMHPDDQEKTQDAINKLFDKGEKLDLEVRIRNKEDHWVWLHFQSNTVMEYDGETCFFGVVSNINNRKVAEERIQESEIRFRTMAETSPDGVTTTDLEGKIIFASKRILELHGYENLNEIRGLDSLSLIAPEDRERANRINQDIERKDSSLNNEFDLLRKDGTTFIGELAVSAITDESGMLNGYIGITRDITERKSIESALRQSEERYRLLIENIPDVTWTSDTEGRTIFISPNVEKVYGYSPREILKGDEDLWFGRVHSDDLQSLNRAYNDLFEKGTSFDIEYQIKRKDGQWIWLHDRAIMTYEDSRKSFAYGVFSDITEKKRAEEALIESEMKFRELANNLEEVFWIVSSDWSEVIYISPSYEKVWGKSKESLYEKASSWIDPIFHEDRIRVEEKIRSLESDFDIIEFPDYRIVQPEGDVRWIRARGYPVKDESGIITRIAGIAEDITLRKKTDEVLQKLVGNTAGFTGEAYFTNLVNELSKTIDADHVFIGIPSSDKPERIQTLAVSHKGVASDNFTYDLIHTPCKDVLAQGFCQYQENVQSKFPKDQLLIDMGITSYSGINLIDTNGNMMGILVVLNKVPFAEPEFVKNIIQISAVRTGAELERAKADEALAQSEASFKALLNATTEIGFLLDKEGVILTLNAAFARPLGKSVESLIGLNAFDTIPVEIARERRKYFDEVGQTGKPIRFEDQNDEKWFDNSIYPVLNNEGEITRYAVYSTDITLRKQTDRELKVYQDNLRSMATELASVEDREKRKIAEYLHDNLGQSLALARIKTGKLLRKANDQDTTNRLNDIENDIADAINYTQSVIYELSPPILYELGLLEALKWKMDNFEKKHGLKTRFIAPPKITGLNEDINILLFRSITELLNNVIKHANAGCVDLEITEDPDRLTIALRDDGTGFDYYPDKFDPSKELKFGIFSIRERVNHYGGAMDISSDKGEGSIVTIFVPLNQSP